MYARERKKSYSDLEAIVVGDDAPAAPKASSTPVAPPSARNSYWNEKFAVSDDSSASSPSHNVNYFSDNRSASNNNNNNNNNTVDPFSARRSASNHINNPFLDDRSPGLSPVSSPQISPPSYYLVDSQGQAQALYAAPANGPTKDPLPTPGSLGGIGGAGIFGGSGSSRSNSSRGGAAGDRRTLFGLRRSTFFALAAGAVFLIIGLFVTILAVTAPWNKAAAGLSSDDDDDGAASSVSPAAGVIMPGSRLAALNWTDSTGTSYTGVFYQSSNATGAAIMAAIRPSDADAWTSINVSASANPAGLDVLAGTPLAAASNNGLWNVYYLTSGRKVAELYSTNPSSPSGWLQGGMGSSLGNPEAAAGSGLAAVWQNCDNCTDSLLVLYQDAATGYVQMGNMTDLEWAVGDVVSTSAAPGTGLGLSAFTDFGGNGSTGTDLNAVRLYYADGGNLIEKLSGPLTGFRLEMGNFGRQITSNLSVDPSPEIASLTFGTKGWTNNIVITLDKTTGVLQSAVYRGSDWAVQTAALDGSPDDVVEEGFSALAVTQTMKMFVVGKSDGVINEYQTSISDPFQWEWLGVVDVPGAKSDDED